jgi:CHAT domain-containing protein
MVGEREVLRRGLDPGLRTTYEQLQQARQELSSLYVKGPEADQAGFNARMAELAGRIDGLESRLSQGSAAFKESREMLSVTPEAVRVRLPQGSALVEYLEFTNYAVKGNPPWLAAFVLDAGGQAPPRLVDLGASAPAAQAITEWRSELRAFAAGRGADEQAARRRLDALGRKVAALIWDPVAARGDLPHKRIVYLAPDGPMHLMPFAPLPSGPGYLIEQVNLACVSTGKDFLRERRPGARSGALLVGGVDFALDLAAPARASAQATRAVGRFSRLNDLQWNALPGTGEEVDAIAAAMAGAHLPAILLKGGQAQKASVDAGFASARYIHLATHGFFLGDEVGLDPQSRGIAVLGNRPVEDAPPGERLAAAPVFHQENPLLLSGLVLAGANQRGGWNGDGYLLAMDVANLDLAGVDLVTLSACETGLGEIKRGEGVFGLQRSFVMAGAEALVMSLWNVPDRETKDLMVDFYRQILAGGSQRESFRQSQLRMLRSGPGGAARHPFFWAAFQYLGVD